MKATVVILKGNPDMEGNRQKIAQCGVLMEFVKLCVPKAELLQDDACFLLNLPNEKEGDTQWVVDNVMRKTYWDNTSNEREAKAKAEKLYEIYKAAGGKDQVGIGLVRKYLYEWYLIQRSASIFVR